MGKLRIPTVDYNGDGSTIQLPVDNAITDPNITTLFASIDGVIIVNTGQSVLVTEANKNAGPGGQPGSPLAQREIKWLVRYHDAVTLKARILELPGADLNLLGTGSEFMALGAGAGATLKAQWDAFVVDPETGNATVLDSVQFVARNL